MTINEAYYLLEGLAYLNGFDRMISKERFVSLYRGLFLSKGHRYFEDGQWVKFFLHLLRNESQ